MISKKNTVIDISSSKLVQLDTNALSNIVKAKDEFLPRLLKRYDVDNYVFCYSPFSILEIKKSQFLYENFCEVFSLLPSFLLKGYFHIWNEEIQNYRNKKVVDCRHFCLHDIDTQRKMLAPQHVRSIFSHPKLEKAFAEWEIEKRTVFSKILKAREDHGANLGYNAADILNFVRGDTFLQIKAHDETFVLKENLDSEAFDLSRFPSFKTTSFLTYFKWHNDGRKPVLSDLYDLLISCTAPYVDIFVTEAQVADSIKKTRKIDNFLDRLEVLTVRDI